VLDGAGGRGPLMQARLVRDGLGSGSDAEGVEGSGGSPEGLAGPDDGTGSLDFLPALRVVHPVGPALPLLVQLAQWGESKKSNPAGEAAQAGQAGPAGPAVSGKHQAEGRPRGAARLKFDRYHCLEVAINDEAGADADA